MSDEVLRFWLRIATIWMIVVVLDVLALVAFLSTSLEDLGGSLSAAASSEVVRSFRFPSL